MFYAVKHNVSLLFALYYNFIGHILFVAVSISELLIVQYLLQILKTLQKCSGTHCLGCKVAQPLGFVECFIFSQQCNLVCSYNSSES